VQFAAGLEIGQYRIESKLGEGGMSGVWLALDTRLGRRVLVEAVVEAAKLAPLECHELAVIRARELEKGNSNRATLAVARKMVCYMLAVERRKQDFVPAKKIQPNGSSLTPFLLRKRQKYQDSSMRRLPGLRLPTG
jgi:hypothetical protein